MKLVSCNILGYGKLKDVKIDFNEGLNSFCYENGWGKSTICSFIKVMLFGFDDEGKTSILNERTHYLPWNGGVYGGSLTIDVDGKQYEIRREFQAKKNTCDFSLFDAKTGLASNDYSEKIGEEILGIDMESFKRTLFIAQTDMEYKATDNINAKIGNLVDNTDDMNTYEIVDENLKNLLNKCSNTRSTGKLSKINQKLSELKVKMAEGNGLDEKAMALLDNINRVKSEIKKKEEDRKNLSAKLKVIGEYKDMAEKKVKYEAILNSYNERKATYDEISNYFEKGLPEASDIENNIKNLSELNVLEARRDNLGSYLTSEEADSIKRDETRLSKLEKLYGAGKYDDIYTGTLMQRWQELKEARTALPLYTANLAAMKNTQKEDYESRLRSKKKKVSMLIVFAIASIIVASIVAGLGYMKMLGNPLVLYSAAGLLSMIGIICFIMASSSNKKEVTISTNEGIDNLEEEIAEREDFIDEVMCEVQDYLDSFSKEFHESMVIEQLFAIRNEAAEYEKLVNNNKENASQLLDKQKKYDDACNRIAEIKAGIATFLDSIGMEAKDDLLVQFHSIKNKAAGYDSAKTQYLKVLSEKEEFEKTYENYEELLTLKKPESDETVAEIEDKVIAITNEQRICDKELKDYETELDNVRSKISDIAMISEEYDDLKEEYEEGLLRYDVVSKAKQYLQEAKINLTTRYTKPVKDAFDKYYNMMTNLCQNEYSLDASMGMSIDNTTKKMSLDYLSKGNQDVVNMCMRLALIDGVYTDDKPFIVLDDPFERLDDERIRAGRKFIEGLAKDKQIIYFTCCEGRNV